MKLKDKVALVTGAGSGIGRAIALRFAAEGARVVLNDLHKDVAEKTLAEIGEGHGSAIQADVADSGQVRAFGVRLEKAAPGVEYDSLGLNGAYVSVLARIKYALHRRGIYW